MICKISAVPEKGGTQISVKRFLNAGESSFLPKSPPGFIVAKNSKPSCALTKELSMPFSARRSVRDGSSTEFSLSSTESSARDISSRRKNWPFLIACTKLPSAHSNKALLLTSLALIFSNRSPGIFASKEGSSWWKDRSNSSTVPSAGCPSSPNASISS
ncbi:hypothetical protein BX600DRAFT_471385 [Xylariales sp. PMI_506]|nr:hypothetical protein BX600DRAFT_471385 [Xylariales sp. PMI_506]